LNPLLFKRVYVPLHVHTAKGSVGDSILKIKDYVAKAKELGLTHLSITNHGSMADMYDFNTQCREADIQPILGCEVYETKNRLSKDKKNSEDTTYWHLVLIAKNEIGLKNLLYITTDAQLNGFYYKPRTDISVLKEHGEGIVAFSACLGGKIPQLLMKEGEKEIQEVYNIEDINKVGFSEDVFKAVEEYKEIFDDFYLELQPGNFKEQIEVNDMLVSLAEASDTKLIITNDVHYLNQEDWRAHDVHVKISRKKKIEDDVVYPDTCYYFMNYSTIYSSFPSLSKKLLLNAINNTLIVSQSCTLNIDTSTLHMPKFSVPKGHSEESYLTKITFEKLEEMKYVLADPAGYSTRLMYELQTINELGFAGYFLTVRDFVLYAKEVGIPVGPGRGSVCGSLAAFLCGITTVDAVKYNLLFERFLSVHRKGSIPDVDLDFAADRREDMFNYAVNKYGSEHCSLVSTLGMRKARASLRDTARVFNIDAEVADEAAKLIPQVYYDDEGEKTTDLSIEESLTIVPRLREMEAEYPEWFHMAQLLENLPSHSSIHPAGTIISPVNLVDYIPLIKPKNEGINATALTLTDAETAKFVKQDFLSLATLTVIGKTERDTGFKFDFINNEFDDEDTWALIGSKHTTGLFQIASRTYKERMFRLKPKTISELAACLALVRGPCISSKMDQNYMEIIEGKREIELIHPFYDDVTAATKGALLYQEQLMYIAVNFGFTLEDSFRLMKAVAKKKKEKIEEFQAQFFANAEKLDVDISCADRIWKIILDAGLYCFNESHAVAYALLCYQSAYLMVHFPLEYLKNCLTNSYLRKEEPETIVEECRRRGIKFSPLDVNSSEWEFSLEEDDTIRIGMCAIKSFGESAAAEVVVKRPFSNMDDFMERVEKGKCSKRAIVPAIFSGLFSEFNTNRKDLYEEFLTKRNEEMVEVVKLQGGQSFSVDDNYDVIEDLLLSAPLMSSPVNNFDPIGFGDMKRNQVFTINAVVRRIKKLRDRNKEMMCFLSLETADGHIDCTMFADVYKNYKSFCKKNLICQVTAKKDKTEDSCIAISVV
jgi:DNA polymerase-3 subunit alpha